MKNVKLFCEMAMLIRKKRRCDTTVSNIYGLDGKYPCCFIGNIFRSGLGGFTEDQAYRLSRSNFDEEWDTTFNMYPPHELLFPNKRIKGTVNCVTGLTYYKECVKILKEHKVLTVLRRMENQAKAA